MIVAALTVGVVVLFCIFGVGLIIAIAIETVPYGILDCRSPRMPREFACASRPKEKRPPREEG